MMEWFASLPTTAAVLLAMSAAAAASVLGLFVVHPIIPQRLRSVHNDVSGFILAIVGVVYAVLLAFIAVAVWQDFDRADQLVQTEANLVADLYRDTAALPDPAAEEVRHYLFVYAETVIQDEWPALTAGGQDDAAGWQLLDRVHLELAKPHAQDSAGVVAGRDGADPRRVVRRAAGAFPCGNGRAAGRTVVEPARRRGDVMLFTYLFGVPHLVMHAAMVGLLGSAIGVVLALIVLLNIRSTARTMSRSSRSIGWCGSVETMPYPHK